MVNSLLIDEQEFTVSSIRGMSPDPNKSPKSALLEGTQRIAYQGAPTDGNEESSGDDFHVDDEDTGPGLPGGDEDEEKEETDSADGDVDEHSDSGGQPSVEQQISPGKVNTEMKRPSNFRPTHRRNLSDVVETGLSSGQVSVDQMFLSPDLVAMKQRRSNPSQGFSDGGKPAFRQGVGAGKKQKVPAFSLQLMAAVQELKENEGGQDDEEDLPSSVRDRRVHHQNVYDNVDEQLRKLIELKMQKQNMLEEASELQSNGYFDDSSQLQSFANSPDVHTKYANYLQQQLEQQPQQSPLKNISPVKFESPGPLKNFTPMQPKSTEKNGELIHTDDDDDEEDDDLDGVKFEMYSPDEEQPMPRIPFGVQSTSTQANKNLSPGKTSLLGSMKDYLARKKLNFDNMITKLNEVENRLQMEQEQEDKRTQEEEKVAAVMTELEDQMAEAYFYVNSEMDRDVGAMSKSSGGGTHTATTREDTDADEEHSTFATSAKQEALRRKIKRIRQLKKMQESQLNTEIIFDCADAEKKNPQLFVTCVNTLDTFDITKVDPNLIDSEYFAIKTLSQAEPERQQATYTVEPNLATQSAEPQTEDASSDFIVVPSPEKKLVQHPPVQVVGRKKKFVKRLVPKPGAKPKKQQGSSETQKVKEMFSNIFNVDGFKLF